MTTRTKMVKTKYDKKSFISISDEDAYNALGKCITYKRPHSEEISSKIAGLGRISDELAAQCPKLNIYTSFILANDEELRFGDEVEYVILTNEE